MYGDLLDAVLNMAKQLTDMPIYKGAMPQPESVCIEIASGAPTSTMFSGNTIENIPMVVNAKSKDMQQARKALDSIHRGLTRAESYPNTSGMQIVSIETNSAPSANGRDSLNWLFVSSIKIHVFFK